MKAIINGKRYDTDKARLIVTATDVDHAHISDPNSDMGFPGWWEESLYRKLRNKEAFLLCKSGPRGPHAKHLGGGAFAAGKRIIPMTEGQVIAWTEHHRPPQSPDSIMLHSVARNDGAEM